MSSENSDQQPIISPNNKLIRLLKDKMWVIIGSLLGSSARRLG